MKRHPFLKTISTGGADLPTGAVQNTGAAIPAGYGSLFRWEWFSCSQDLRSEIEILRFFSEIGLISGTVSTSR